jgi:hypothetical protein
MEANMGLFVQNARYTEPMFPIAGINVENLFVLYWQRQIIGMIILPCILRLCSENKITKTTIYYNKQRCKFASQLQFLFKRLLFTVW